MSYLSITVLVLSFWLLRVKYKIGMVYRTMARKTLSDTHQWTPERLRSLRNLYAETQKVFGSRMGASAEAVRAWESGRNPIPVGAAILLDQLWTLRARETRGNGRVNGTAGGDPGLPAE
jgi:DNA-binding transcriptional regulator YiaG